ncbi:MAG: homoserine dehydrogenase [Trueperaceae bacterium]
MTRIGLLGAGTVGSKLVDLIEDRDELGFRVSKVLVRDLNKARGKIPTAILTTQPKEILAESDIVVEVMGGTTVASETMMTALEGGKRVVTANKAALAEGWDGFKPFIKKGQLYFEASVMAGTPTIGALTGVLRGSRPLELHAILNGTCNYILGEIEKGVAYKDALAEAQKLGYAEADPSLDVEGFDAAHKLTVLARLVFEPNLAWEEVKAQTRGITHITAEMMQRALKRQGRIRLLGSVYPENNDWNYKVRPVFIPNSHPMAGAASNRNALYFRGDAVGTVFITGAGAGGAATASGVLSDIICAAQGAPGPSLLSKSAVVPKDVDVEILEEV